MFVPHCIMKSVAILATVSGLVGVASAQTFAAGVGTVAPAMHIGESGSALPGVPGHRKGSEDRLLYARVRNGVYMVDGLVGKVRLNYDVQGVHFMYMFVPGLGTAVLSVSPVGDALVVPVTLQDGELSFEADEHHFKLTGISIESDKGQPPAHLFVRLDRTAWQLSRHPMVGYGNLPQAPYEWPGSLPGGSPEQSREAPPVPLSLLPRTASTASIASAPPAPLSPAALR